MSIELQMRTAHSKDLQSIQQLFVQSIQQLCQNDYTPAQILVWTASIKDEARWLGFIQNDYLLLAYAGENLAGFTSLTDGDYLNLLYVHPGYTRLGVASQLLSAIQSRTAQLGHKIMTTHASKTARSFFERKGFEVIRENRKLVRDIVFLNYEMRCKV